MSPLRAIRHAYVHSLGACWELFRLAALSRFRMRGAYWKWRMETAFGAGAPKSRLAALRAMLEYGAWVYEMRRR